LAIAIIVTSVINEAFLSTFFLAHEIAHAVVLFLATLEPTFLREGMHERMVEDKVSFSYFSFIREAGSKRLPTEQS